MPRKIGNFGRGLPPAFPVVLLVEGAVSLQKARVPVLPGESPGRRRTSQRPYHRTKNEAPHLRAGKETPHGGDGDAVSTDAAWRFPRMGNGGIRPLKTGEPCRSGGVGRAWARNGNREDSVQAAHAARARPYPGRRCTRFPAWETPFIPSRRGVRAQAWAFGRTGQHGFADSRVGCPPRRRGCFPAWETGRGCLGARSIGRRRLRSGRFPSLGNQAAGPAMTAPQRGTPWRAHATLSHVPPGLD